MADHGLAGHRPRRRRSLTKPDAASPPAPDLLGRLFDPDQPDVAWCGDVTYVPTEEGWLYLASVIDLASRHLLGWSMGERHHARLVTDALAAAVATRGRQRMDATIFHTDRGSEGGFNRSSQHLEMEVWRWVCASVRRRSVRCVARCGRQGGRRRQGVKTGSGSGKRLLVGCRARTRRARLGCRRRSGRGGSVKLAGCHRSR
jgi:hypothetical protein